MTKKLFILGSSSASRLELLQKIYLSPDLIISPDIDETPLKKEKPRLLAKRLAFEKNLKIQKDLKEKSNEIIKDKNLLELFNKNKYCILTADTVAVKGTRILEKSYNKEEIRKYLKLISGSSHRVYTAMSIFDGESKNHITKLSESRIKFKRLSSEEIEFYLKIKEGEGNAGGYSISKYAGRFVEKIIGSPTSISGLDLRIAFNLLNGCGFGFSKEEVK